ncbi:MAG: hypothetical protein RX318_12030 [bacterium]|nr:hypothetical protein [bacterium]
MFSEVLRDDENRPIALRFLGPTTEELDLMAQIIEQGPQLKQSGAQAWLLAPADQEPDPSREGLGSGQWIG